MKYTQHLEVSQGDIPMRYYVEKFKSAFSESIMRHAEVIVRDDDRYRQCTTLYSELHVFSPKEFAEIMVLLKTMRDLSKGSNNLELNYLVHQLHSKIY